MAAPIGNRFWEARSSHGRKPIFDDPEQLWTACVEYFEWVEENPLYESKAFHNSGEVVTAKLPKMRAMTMMGLCNFLDIHHDTWGEYRKKDDFSEICARVDDVIRQQKFEGASADLLNASIIARDLGLADKHAIGGDKTMDPIQTEDVSPVDRLAEFINAKSRRQSRGDDGSGEA